MRGPVVDAAAVCGGRADDVGCFGLVDWEGLVYGCMGWVGLGAYVVVEGFGFAVGELYQFCLLV